MSNITAIPLSQLRFVISQVI